VYNSYRAACTTGDLTLERVFTVPIDGSKYIVHFATKRHYYDSSRLEDIEVGLQSLVQEVRDLGITSIAIPALGCGLGKLEWMKVRQLITDAFAGLSDVRVLLFLPHSRPRVTGSQSRRTKRASAV